MSLLSRASTESRIKTASKDSQIIVEKSMGGDYESYFADTIHGFMYLQKPPQNYIGTFYGAEGVFDFNTALGTFR